MCRSIAGFLRQGVSPGKLIRGSAAVLLTVVLASCGLSEEQSELPQAVVLVQPAVPVSISEPVVHNPDESQGSEPRMVLRSVISRDKYLPEQVDFINKLLRFKKTVTVLNEVEEGPLFDPDTQEIWMPGSFADVIESYFGTRNAPVADVYLHTLIHEVGHVLYSQYDMPLLAREEDAADALASVLLLEYVEDGARVVLNAAEMFGLESERFERQEEPDFWSEHSLDIQRFHTTLCHVYGSDPEAHADLLDAENGLTQARAQSCQYEYERIRKGWLGILKPYLKR
ncbi:DUF4344 domain-containing metallopeptidase [Granulosicoccus antarcticus]|uniref:Uncharacterized protein n=1 Tax=Granulosicoccus antarcticus IMCC3135 TaxID=1192854 RepID=A0A2Z2P3W6_9GAMM|nr:DUF4344 domain-containing metallopeptidase [Granulosicoccus antarcticus]ASJ76100.1 hypothetical protein IMCC3135_30255 [Granulosicoccus antarcticus IMCC3135]